MDGLIVWSQLGTLLLPSLVVMGSPGPATISLTAVGAGFGLKPALPYAAGVIAGAILVLLAVAAGLMSTLLSIPGAAPVLAVASSLYILYLAFRIATAPPLAEARGTAAAPSFAGGLTLAVANPKAWLAIGAVFAGATLAPESPVADAVLKTVALSAMIALIHMAWLFAGASFSRALRHRTLSRIVNLLFAAVLVATAVAAIPR